LRHLTERVLNAFVSNVPNRVGNNIGSQIPWFDCHTNLRAATALDRVAFDAVEGFDHACLRALKPSELQLGRNG
jgi:hypothetical protein